MEIELSPDQKRRLEQLAREEGKPAGEVLREILDEALTARTNDDEAAAGAGQASLAFHGACTDLGRLFASQGVKPVTRFEDLLGDFWPEDESADDFIASVREWRRAVARRDRAE